MEKNNNKKRKNLMIIKATYNSKVQEPENFWELRGGSRPH